MSLNKKSILLILVSVVISAASAKQLSAVGPIRIKSDDQLYCRIVPCTVERYTKSANSVAMRVGHRCRVEFAVCHINSMQQFLGSNGDLWSDYEFQQWYPYPTSVPLIKISQESISLQTYIPGKKISSIFLEITGQHPGQTTVVFSIKPRDGASVCKTCSIHVTVED